VNLSERRLFREQLRKELIDEFKKYEVGQAYNNHILANKTTLWNGRIFVVPEDKYKEWVE